MIVRIIEDKTWAGEEVTQEFTFPNVNGTYTVNPGRIIDQSDRIRNRTGDNPSDPDTYKWAYWVGLIVDMDITVTVTGNKITASIGGFDDWRVERVQTPATCQTGTNILVPGNYDYFSSINSALIHNYQGPNRMCQGDATYPGNGSTATFNTGLIAPQTESAHYQFAWMHNNVQRENYAYAYVSVFNDLPNDYRPGTILNNSSIWLSHNRTNGEAHILKGNGKWAEMRTVEGHNENNNPPSIRTTNRWTNQLLLGKED